MAALTAQGSLLDEVSSLEIGLFPFYLLAMAFYHLAMSFSHLAMFFSHLAISFSYLIMVLFCLATSFSPGHVLLVPIHILL